MAQTPGASVSASQNLDIAICVLSLITRRPLDLDKSVAEKGSSRCEDGADEPENEAEIEQDRDIDGQMDLDSRTLRSKFLDRLAETLARYKTDPRDTTKSGLDARHVSSTMMVIDERLKKAKIFCSKNEGLDQEAENEDTAFLARWRGCMEGVARKGESLSNAASASNSRRKARCARSIGPDFLVGRVTMRDTERMFDLVLEHQRPRVNYYIQKLRDVFQVRRPQRCALGNNASPGATILTEASVRQLPPAGLRTWVDDRGNTFKFHPSGSYGLELAGSEVAITADSLNNVVSEVDSIFQALDDLCGSYTQDPPTPARELTKQQETSLLKDLITTTWTLWRGVRHQSYIKTRLRQRFEPVQEGDKRYDRAVSTLKFLCRIRQSVFIFMEAAATIAAFRSIECVPILVPRVLRHPEPDPTRKSSLPQIITGHLGLTLNESSWARHFQQDSTKRNFRRFWKEKRHVHAEIQMLYAHATLALTQAEGWVPHAYIGCSRRCCMLCYCLILSYGGFQVRGSHETVMHRWAVPTIPLSAHGGVNESRFRAATERLLEIIKLVLQGLLDHPYPLDEPQLLPQSSAALSTAKTILDREISKMEKSQLYMR